MERLRIFVRQLTAIFRAAQCVRPRRLTGWKYFIQITRIRESNKSYFWHFPCICFIFLHIALAIDIFHVISR